MNVQVVGWTVALILALILLALLFTQKSPEEQRDELARTMGVEPDDEDAYVEGSLEPDELEDDSDDGGW